MLKDNKGFTLLEVMLVVAIIGCLVSLMPKAIDQHLEVSREAADKANIKTAVELLTIAVANDADLKEVAFTHTKVKGIVGKVYKVKSSTKSSVEPGMYVTSVLMKQKKAKWQTISNDKFVYYGTKSLSAKNVVASGPYFYIAMDQAGNIVQTGYAKK